MEDYEELMEELGKIKKGRYLVIVEGNKDKKALEAFGIKNITTLDRPLYKVVENVAESREKCIILTDLDKKGRQLYGKLNSDLQKNGVHINNRFREFLFKKTKLRQIEGLVSYIAHVE